MYHARQSQRFRTQLALGLVLGRRPVQRQVVPERGSGHPRCPDLGDQINRHDVEVVVHRAEFGDQRRIRCVHEQYPRWNGGV